jgi:hypothetical protein
VDLSSHSATELNNVSSAGSGIIITAAERTKIGSNETAITSLQTGALGDSVLIEGSVSAELALQSNQNLISGVAQIKQIYKLNRAGANWSYTHRLQNRYGSMFYTLEHTDSQSNSVESTIYCIRSTENNGASIPTFAVFGGKYGSSVSSETACQAQLNQASNNGVNFLSAGVTELRELRLTTTSTPASETETAVKGTVKWDSDNLYLASDTNLYKKVPLQAFGAVSSTPNKLTIDLNHSTSSSNYAPNWYLIAPGYDEYEIILGGDSGYSFLRNFNLTLPTFVEGMKITIHNMAATLRIRASHLNSGNGYLAWFNHSTGLWQTSVAANLGLEHEQAQNKSSTIIFRCRVHPNSATTKYFTCISGNVEAVSL